MDEMHASIDAHLRRQRQVWAMMGRHEAHIFGTWRERSTVPRCKICGATIGNDKGQLYNLADMLTVRQCREHYRPF